MIELGLLIEDELWMVEDSVHDKPVGATTILCSTDARLAFRAVQCFEIFKVAELLAEQQAIAHV